MTTAALTFPGGLNRTDKGVYSCIVENKHGSNVANITMNILCEFSSARVIHTIFPFLSSPLVPLVVPMIVFKHQPRIILVFCCRLVAAFFIDERWKTKRNDRRSGRGHPANGEDK